MNAETRTLIENALTHLADALLVLDRDHRRSGWLDPQRELVAGAELALLKALREDGEASAEMAGLAEAESGVGR